MFELSKRAAAARALTLVESGMTLGLGTGSTSEAMTHGLAARIRDEGLRVRGVPTSEAILQLARDLGIPVLDSYPDFEALDLALDGADEVDPSGGLIKGGGGALLREKLVAGAARRFVVMVDPSKHVGALGSTRGIPVEAIPFGLARLRARLTERGARAELRGAETPFRTDSGNVILDCWFGPLADPASIASQLEALPGVVESGLFLGMATDLVTGREDSTAERHP